MHCSNGNTKRHVVVCLANHTSDSHYCTNDSRAHPHSATPALMDTETLQPSDDPAPAAAIMTTTTTSVTEATAAAETTQLENAGPPPAPKRQRRPSVRLGDIGGQPAAALSYDSHVRRSTSQHFHPPWGTHRDPSSSKSTVKARSMTNLVNGNRADHHTPNDRNNNQNDNTGEGVEFGYRKAKAKRGATKRVRSNWVSSSSKPEEGDGIRDESPVNSVENELLDFWNGQGRLGSYQCPNLARVSNSRDNISNELDYNPRDSDSRGTSEGVMSWLIDLGLSRYAPAFEIHEVDGEVLPMLTLEDLKDMGISAVGSRRKLYAAIQKLRRGLS